MQLTSTGLLAFGGTTNAFPAIKRNSAAIDFRLADDSAFCNVNAANIDLTGAWISTSGEISGAGSILLGTRARIYRGAVAGQLFISDANVLNGVNFDFNTSETVSFRNPNNTAFAFAKGKIQTDTNHTATGDVSCNGYLTLYDAAGTAYKVMTTA
jgi:hypothetical protein